MTRSKISSIFFVSLLLYFIIYIYIFLNIFFFIIIIYNNIYLLCSLFCIFSTTKNDWIFIYFSFFVFFIKHTVEARIQDKILEFYWSIYTGVFSPRAPFSRFVFNRLNLRTRIQRYFIKTQSREEGKTRSLEMTVETKQSNRKKVRSQKTSLRERRSEETSMLSHYSLYSFYPFFKLQAYWYCSDIVIIPDSTAKLAVHRGNAELIIIFRCLIALNSNRLRRRFGRNCARFCCINFF